MDKFNRGVFGEWHFEDLWNTRHGDAPGMEKYWKNQHPEADDPRVNEDLKYKDSKKKETKKMQKEVFENSGLVNDSGDKKENKDE